MCHNHIEGTISADISVLSSLVVFYASYNKLSGPIPGGLCSLVDLRKLNLSNNNLNGSLPAAFGDLRNLEVCILGTRFLVYIFNLIDALTIKVATYCVDPSRCQYQS